MRIGILTHNYPRFPGDFSGTFIKQLCEELVSQGEEVCVIAPFDDAFDPVVLHQTNPRLYLYRYAWPDSAHKLGYMRTMQADVRMRINTYLLSPLLFLRGIQTIQRVTKEQQLDILHAHWALPSGYTGAIASRRLDIPLVVSIPGSDALVAGQNALFRNMVQVAFNQAGLITANSRSLRDVAIGQLGADPDKFELVIYAVDPDAFVPDDTGTIALRERLGIPQNAFVFLAVGRMVYKKGFDVLLKALADLQKIRAKQHPVANVPEVHTLMIGEGDLWRELQQLAHNLRLVNIHWLGNIPVDQMSVRYNAADVLVMPNVTKPATGLGVTVLDAMACGKAIIGSDTAGNPLVVEPGVNGFIVPEGEPLQLAEAMWLLVTNPTLAKEMGENSRRLIETRFGWPHIVRHYRQRYQLLVNGTLRLEDVE
ncbi:MAG: glycosyltransferase family 4 protein [Chloroflexi bacterium]|nr:glycosyltransferase family 4 protein [Chloroflexota bacterium]